MNLSHRVMAIGLLLTAIVPVRPCSGANKDSWEISATRFMDGAALIEARKAYARGDARYVEAVEVLVKRADEALKQEPVSVMDKELVPPSGDKHDYMSMGSYWWPDPDKPDGKPYIRRDGYVNPEANRLDAPAMHKMASAVNPLALAWFYTREEKYADHAATLLRVWFLNEATRMNPHLQYGQGIPGRMDGRGIGIIDTARLARMVDSVELLKGSKAWTAKDDQALRGWFRAYLKWLLESDHGIDEARQPNNHATHYDVQVARFALFVGDEDTARRILREHGPRRIATQVEPDGRQPWELRRTKAFGYSMGNLTGFFEAATLGEHVGVDLWHFKTDDGRCIKAALDWLIPYGLGEREFPYEELHQITPNRLRPLLMQATEIYNDPAYRRALAKIPEDDDAKVLLLQPAHVTGQKGKTR